MAKKTAKKLPKTKTPRKPVSKKHIAKPAVKPAHRAKVVPPPPSSAPKTARAPKTLPSDKPGSSGPEDIQAQSLAASPLKPKDLQFFADLLLAKRRELLGDVDSMEQEALRSTTGSNLSNLPIHMADMGTDNYEQEFTLGLVEKDRQLLKEIYIALDKIKKGTYGICEGTGKPITRARLEAKPWARHSLEYTVKLEKGLIRR